MNIKLKVLLLSVVISVSSLSFAQVESDPPVLNSISLDKDGVNVSEGPQTITMTIDASDETGIDWSGSWVHVATSGGTFREPCGSNDKPGEIKFEITSSDPNGVWTVSYMFLTDLNGNQKSYNELNKQISVSGGLESDPPILNSISLDKDEVTVSEGPQTIRMTIDASDETGIDWSGSWVHVATSGGTFREPRGSNDKPGEIKFEITSSDPMGIWTVSYMFLTDLNGNRKMYSGLNKQINVLLDSDGDGVADLAELTAGTSLVQRDTDFDSLSDKFEIDSNSRNPLKADYDISSASNHTCVSQDDGVKCWGLNTASQLDVPTGLNGNVQLELGNYNSCALKQENGEIVCWGEGGSGRAPVGLGYSQIAVGGYHTCALKNGLITCAGLNGDGQGSPPDISGVLKVVAGSQHSCALTNTTVHCWGKNQYGETDVPNLVNPSNLFSNTNTVCAMHDDGLTCWGKDDSGLLSPPILSASAEVSIGRGHACAIDNKLIKCWGNNYRGNTSFPDLTNPVQLAIGTLHSCALSDEGVTCWGESSDNRTSAPNTLTFGDFDRDGKRDNIDSDDDNDSVSDENDIFPLDATESIDTDGDGIGNNADTDDDGDSVSDSDEISNGTNPLSADTDGDGVNDNLDALPTDATEAVDTDSDGIGNNADTDDDGDTLLDQEEIDLGLNPLSDDTDNDGISDSSDESTAVFKVDFPNVEITFITPGITPESGGLRFKSPNSIGVNNFISLDQLDSAENKAVFKYEFHPLTPSGNYSIGNNGRTVITYSDGGRIEDYSKYSFNLNNSNGLAGTPEVVEYEIKELPNNRLKFDLRFSNTIGGIALRSPTNQQNLAAFIQFSFADSIDSRAETIRLDLKATNLVEVEGGFFKYSNSFDVPETYDAGEARVFQLGLLDGALNELFAYIDSDNDLAVDQFDAFPSDPDEYRDSDGDGTGNYADTDDDNDGVDDSIDVFPLDATESVDTDSDGIGNNADTDDDNDGVADSDDAFPLDSAESSDSDGDGLGDNSDAFPNDSSETVDSDNDGTGDNADAFPNNALYKADSDSDGMPDAWETRYGLDPNDPSDATSDQDNDGITALDEFLAGTIPSGSLDIDGNENYDALTDGLLLLRGMFGLDGSALVTGTIASDAAYTESVDIESRIATLGDLADIDGNGTIDALTDGLLTLRYLFGLQGDTLINGVVAEDATRTTAEEIEAYLETLMPAL